MFLINNNQQKNLRRRLGKKITLFSMFGLAFMVLQVTNVGAQTPNYNTAGETAPFDDGLMGGSGMQGGNSMQQ